MKRPGEQPTGPLIQAATESAVREGAAKAGITFAQAVKKLRGHGVHVIVDLDVWPPGSIVACDTRSTPSAFTDNLLGVCAKCSIPIHWRPHQPAEVTKVCLKCAGVSAWSLK